MNTSYKEDVQISNKFSGHESSGYYAKSDYSEGITLYDFCNKLDEKKRSNLFKAITDTKLKMDVRIDLFNKAIDIDFLEGVSIDPNKKAQVIKSAKSKKFDSSTETGQDNILRYVYDIFIADMFYLCPLRELLDISIKRENVDRLNPQDLVRSDSISDQILAGFNTEDEQSKKNYRNIARSELLYIDNIMKDSYHNKHNAAKPLIKVTNIDMDSIRNMSFHEYINILIKDDYAIGSNNSNYDNNGRKGVYIPVNINGKNIRVFVTSSSDIKNKGDLAKLITKTINSYIFKQLYMPKHIYDCNQYICMSANTQDKDDVMILFDCYSIMEDDTVIFSKLNSKNYQDAINNIKLNVYKSGLSPNQTNAYIDLENIRHNNYRD